MDEISTTGRVAVVVGGSKGIGAQIVRCLAAEGFRIVMNYANDAVAAERLRMEFIHDQSPIICVGGDIADPHTASRLFDIAEKSFDGGVDVVVNCAAVHAPPATSVADTSDETFDRILDVNIRGAFYLLRESASRMRSGGSIVTFSSSALVMGAPGQPIYNASKAWIEAITGLLAKELAGRGITANTIAPGPTATEFFMNSRPPEIVTALANQTPLGRIGTPNDIAAVVSFLLSTQGRWVNGQTIRVNGGLA